MVLKGFETRRHATVRETEGVKAIHYARQVAVNISGIRLLEAQVWISADEAAGCCRRLGYYRKKPGKSDKTLDALVFGY